MKMLVCQLRRLLMLGAFCASTLLQAQQLQPFEVEYKARYGSLAATAARTLRFDANSGQWRFGSVMGLQLFGATVTEIQETSVFAWRDNLPLPARYDYQQRGVGSRSRSLEFSGASTVHFINNDEQGTLRLDAPAYDDLNSFLVLREQLRAGVTDVSFNVVDRNEIETHRYQVVGEEMLVTPAGSFNTLHVSRIRDAGNPRTTDLWLATGQDYLLVKLQQDEPNGDSITLELEDGTLNGQPLRGN